MGNDSSCRSLLIAATEFLQRAGIDTAFLDALALLAEACSVDRARILADTILVTPEQRERFETFLRRRAAREPLAYIVGHKEFFSLQLFVAPGVLIPRPETEILVEAALSLAKEIKARWILDLGTGSGAIAIALAKQLPKVHVIATDISAEALEIARRNAALHGLLDRIRFVRGDMWNPFKPSGQGRGPFDIVISNPPYVPEAQLVSLQPEIRWYEPRIALCGGADGLMYHRRIAADAASYISLGGTLLLEVGQGQADAVARICTESGAREVKLFKDLAGVDRVIAAQF